MREYFKRIDNVPVSIIKLDPNNIRFDDDSGNISQVECLKRMMDANEGNKLVALAEHIAQKGIGVVPIVLIKDESNDYVVKDGNRRVAALQMLLNPERCLKSKHYRAKFVSIKSKYEQLGYIVPTVECLVCDDEQALYEHLYITHAGEMDGVGQVTHQTQAKDRLRTKLRGKPTRHGQVYEWLKKRSNKIEGINEFKLTNVSRLTLSKESLKKLGFAEDESGAISTVLPEIEICYIWAYLVKRIESVSDIYHAPERNGIIEEAIIAKDLQMSVDDEPEDDGDEENGAATEDPSGSQKSGNHNKDRGGSGSASGNSNNSGSTNPQKKSTNRRFLITKNHKISIPFEYMKARNIVVELKNLELSKFINAASVLLRALLDITLYAYCDKHNCLPNTRDQIRPASLLNIALNHCKDDPKLKTTNSVKAWRQLCNPQNRLSIGSLNMSTHDPGFTVTAEELCSFYDTYDNLFEYLWKEVATQK